MKSASTNKYKPETNTCNWYIRRSFMDTLSTITKEI